MKMPKATDEDKERFRELMAVAPGVEVKPMFGQLGAFVNGNMCAGLFGSSIGVKLDADDAAVLAGLGGGPFGPEERPMGGYLTLPDGVDAADWVARSAAYVGSLPPKAPKKK
jgi:TfoX/Sxy family transcriptional regulator of competence genes